MKKIILTLWISCISVVLFAQNNNFTFDKVVKLKNTGTLHEQLTPSEMATIQSIKITGNINEADIATLSKMSSLHALQRIDLSEARFAETVNPLLEDKEQYFLPMIAALETEDIEGFEKYEADLGHEKDSASVPGFWIFHTQKQLFTMTGYMRGWDLKINEVVLKSESDLLLRSPQIRSWIETMGYEYKDARSDGDLVFHNKKSNIWCLLHFTPYGKTDFPGIHFSSMEYEIW